jgi:hypothetical protein
MATLLAVASSIWKMAPLTLPRGDDSRRYKGWTRWEMCSPGSPKTSRLESADP